jgi:hypothetical protein
MNKLTLTKCSSILKDPFNNKSRNPLYIAYNAMRTFINLRNFENYFVDFQHVSFQKFAKQIFEEVGYGLKTGNPELFSKNLNENVYYALREEKSDFKNSGEDFLAKIFCTKTSDWEIVHARTLFLAEITEDFSQNYAQITLKYKTEQKPNNYIVFERCLAHGNCFYYWKIFIINYEYFKK